MNFRLCLYLSLTNGAGIDWNILLLYLIEEVKKLRIEADDKEQERKYLIEEVKKLKDNEKDRIEQLNYLMEEVKKLMNKNI